MRNLHVCILGIDGSGKSTVSAALPAVLAGELNCIAGGAGEAFRVVSVDQDLLNVGFHPRGFPVAARLSRLFKRIAKANVDNRAIYPFIKLLQMIMQDAAAWTLAYRYAASIMISDGNTILSALGREANYRSPASDAGGAGPLPDSSSIARVLSYLTGAGPLDREARSRLPKAGMLRMVQRVIGALGFSSAWLPDIVIFLDVSPQTALGRIVARGRKIDRHENLDDLGQARRGYRNAIEAFRAFRLPNAAHIIAVDGLSRGQVIEEALACVRSHVDMREAPEGPADKPLGTSDESTTRVAKKVISPRYVTHYLIGKFASGAWREPWFFVSKLGRMFLREGYSAGVMRVIYDRDSVRYGPMDRIFIGYPLHRAVYDRLRILVGLLAAELSARCAGRDRVRIFTAPSGFAYDILRALRAVRERDPGALSRISLTAADLDPHDDAQPYVLGAAAELGLSDVLFVKGDISSSAVRGPCAGRGPFDMSLFIGLSSWLPKRQTVDQMRWVRAHLCESGVFVTDCFTAQAYALSGHYVGYKAHYYEPEVYTAILDYCGFDAAHAVVRSGNDRINHVVMCGPRAPMNTRNFGNSDSRSSTFSNHR